MSETSTLTAAGLWTNPNELSGRPEGALSAADNVEIPEPGILRPARGMQYRAVPNAADSLSSGIVYGGADFAHFRDGMLERFSAGAWTTVATDIWGADGHRVRFATAGDDLYLTTDYGPKAIDTVTGTPTRPGVPKALDFDYAILYGGLFGGNTGGRPYLEPGNAAAYRAVIGQNDAEGRPQLGAPSGRVFIYNPTSTATLSRTGSTVTLTLSDTFSVGLQSGDLISVSPIDANNPGSTTKTVVSYSSNTITYTEAGVAGASPTEYTVTILSRPVMLGVMLPPGLVAGRHFIQLYRSAQVPMDVSPGDDMRQVAERPLTASEISSGYAYLVDETPDVARGPQLYTNATQEGLAQANERPPLVRDLTMFRQCLVGANVTRPQRVAFRFIGLPTAGDVITVAGEHYVSNVGGLNDSSGNWSIINFSDLTVSQQIERTARSFIRAVNFHSFNTRLRAYYASGADDPPGMVVVEDLEVGNSSFSISVSANGSRYVPDLSAAVESVAESIPNGLIFSKAGLPYAFPPASQHLLRVGAGDKEILRAIGLRDSIWVFKDGDGIWQATGSGPGALYVDQKSPDTQLVAPDSLVLIGNAAYALTNKGVVVVTEGGIASVSVPIEDQLRALLIAPEMLTALQNHAVGVGYSVGTETKYILYVPETSTATSATLAYVFNAAPEIEAWTRRTGDLGVATGAMLGVGGKLVTGWPTGNVLEERRTGQAADYQLADGNAIPIRFGWNVETAYAPNLPKQFQAQTLLFGEPQSGTWTFDWRTDLNETASLEAFPDGKSYAHQWVHPDVSYTTRLRTEFSYDVDGEELSILGLTTQALIFPNGSPEM